MVQQCVLHEYRTAPIGYYIEPMSLRTTADAWMSIGVVASFVVIVAIAVLRRRVEEARITFCIKNIVESCCNDLNEYLLPILRVCRVTSD